MSYPSCKETRVRRIRDRRQPRSGRRTHWTKTWTTIAVVSISLCALSPGRSLAGRETARVRIVAPNPLTLEWCVERALAANPGIERQAAAAEAARHRIRTSSSFDDPRFSYTASNLPLGSFDFGSTPLSGHQLELGQKLPFPGLRASRRDAARADAGAESEILDDWRARVAAEAESRWAKLGFAQRALGITETSLTLARQLSQIATAKYEVGKGFQQDVLRAQLELTGITGERLRRVEALRVAESHLAELLDLPITTQLPATTSLRDESPVPGALAIEGLLERIEETSPTLRALALRIEEAERAKRSAELEGYPDFDLKLGYRIRQFVATDPVAGDDFFSAGVTLRLPVDRRRWRAEVSERAALVRRARSQWRAGRAELRDAARRAYAELARADAEVRLFESGLVPQARLSLDASRSGYEVDKVDFLSLIDSHVQLLDAELKLIRAIADRRTAYATLEGTVGTTLRGVQR